MKFAGYGLCSRNVTALAAFYETAFGCTSEGDDVHRFVNGDGIAFAIHDNGRVADTTNDNVAVVFDVPDVDAEYDRLCALGVTIVEPPTTRPWGMRNLIVADPEGTQIVLRCPAP